MDEGATHRSGEAVVPESEAKMLRTNVRELERLIGRKTMEVESLTEAIEVGRSRKWLPRGSSSSGESGQ